MFELVSKHKRLIQIAFVLLILPPFAFFGLDSYTRSMRGADEVARIDGVPVSQREFEDARRTQLERMRAVLGRGFDPSMLDTPQAREAVLDSLVTQRLASGAALRAGLTVTPEALNEIIASTPAFQRDGKYDEATATAALRAQGMTPELFRARLRGDVAVEQLTRAIAETAVVSRALSAQQAALEAQRREVAEAIIPAQPFAAQVRLEESQLKSYYDANLAQFRVPERVRAEYLVLSSAALASQEPVSEEELKAGYAAREKSYGVAEQRRASHILVKDRATAERLLSEARRAPERFAALARQHSQDTGSAEAGGDLGFFGRGMMVKAFEDAAFLMKPGEITGPVESEFGFHVIRLVAIQPAKLRSLEEVRKELGEELAREKGAKRFAEAAEVFSQMVYEQSDSLGPAALRFKLAVQQSDWLARRDAAAPAPLNHPKLLAALFAQDAIEGRRNTDAIEVAPGVLISARVTAHQPESQRSFEEVRAAIEQRLRRGEAARLAQKEGEAKLAQLESGADAGLKWSAPRALGLKEAQVLSAAARRRIFAAEAGKLPAYAGELRGEQGYAIYRVLRVLPAESRTDAQRAEDLAAAQRRAGSEQLDAWLESQRRRAKIEINRAALERK